MRSTIGGVGALRELVMSRSGPVGAVHELATSVPVGALHELATSVHSTQLLVLYAYGSAYSTDAPTPHSGRAKTEPGRAKTGALKHFLLRQARRARPKSRQP